MLEYVKYAYEKGAYNSELLHSDEDMRADFRAVGSSYENTVETIDS